MAVVDDAVASAASAAGEGAVVSDGGWAAGAVGQMNVKSEILKYNISKHERSTIEGINELRTKSKLECDLRVLIDTANLRCDIRCIPQSKSQLIDTHIAGDD